MTNRLKSDSLKLIDAKQGSFDGYVWRTLCEIRDTKEWQGKGEISMVSYACVDFAPH